MHRQAVWTTTTFILPKRQLQRPMAVSRKESALHPACDSNVQLHKSAITSGQLPTLNTNPQNIARNATLQYSRPALSMLGRGSQLPAYSHPSHHQLPLQKDVVRMSPRATAQNADTLPHQPSLTTQNPAGSKWWKQRGKAPAIQKPKTHHALACAHASCPKTPEKQSSASLAPCRRRAVSRQPESWKPYTAWAMRALSGMGLQTALGTIPYAAWAACALSGRTPHRLAGARGVGQNPTPPGRRAGCCASRARRGAPGALSCCWRRCPCGPAPRPPGTCAPLPPPGRAGGTLRRATQRT